MKKTLIVVFAALLFFGTAKAQILKLGVGPELAVPSGNSSNISSIGIGGYVKFEQEVAAKVSITETAELATFYGKKFLNIRSQNLSYLPVKLGLKYFPSENFYAEGQGGMAFPVNNGGKSNFTWALGIGSFVKSKSNDAQFDIGLRYQALTNTIQQTIETNNRTNFSYIALHVGYVFGF
ncbi:hypothetical protein ABIB40_001544 [Pedobacter sp. UYP30]|uniref:hypothetical protein n=1 Tax=Pedobacter sp. UYP30 TaxID=1756400 RepID=UPI003396E719